MTKRKKFTKSERQQIYDMFNGHCAYCGCEITLKQMQADHIEPLELGGADEISLVNLLLLDIFITSY